MLAPWKSLAGLMQTVVCWALDRLGSRTTRRARAGYIHSREPSVQRRWTCSTARERGSQLKPLPRQHHQSITNDIHSTGGMSSSYRPEVRVVSVQLTPSSWAAFPPQPLRTCCRCSRSATGPLAPGAAPAAERCLSPQCPTTGPHLDVCSIQKNIKFPP